MRKLRAKILDSRHLELIEPLPEGLGQYVDLALLEADEADANWSQMALRHFEEAYAPEDAVYDEL